MRLFISYLGQLTNVGVGILMLPLLLAFLSADEFLLWSLFTSIGGVFLQLETAIQSIFVRSIAARSHGSAFLFEESIQNARRTYRFFAVIAYIALIGGGGLYFASIALTDNMAQWPLQWLLFSTTYFVNFLFGYNNCVLIAAERTTQFNVNNMISRLINLALMAILFVNGETIFALVISFAISVGIGCVSNRQTAATVTRHIGAILSANPTEPGVSQPRLVEIILFALFLGLSYWLYRIVLLTTAATSSNHSKTASFALALQLFAIFVTLALTPVQMRVAPLVSALNKNAFPEAALEFARIHLLVNLGIVASVGGLAAISPMMMRYVLIDVPWPSLPMIAALFFAFLVEINLQAMANIFIARRQYSFLKAYCISTGVALVVGLLLALWARASISTVIFGVAIIQFTIATPSFVKILLKTVPLNGSVYHQVLKESWSKVGRLIGVVNHF